MSTIHLTNKKGELIEIKVLETVDEVWDHVTWTQPEQDYNDLYERPKNIYNKDFLRLNTIEGTPVIISKRFIFNIE